MGEFLVSLAWVAFAAFLVAGGGAVLGGLLIWTLVQRSAVEPADAFDDDEDDDGVFLDEDDWNDGPEDECEGAPDPLVADQTVELERVVVHRQMSAVERMDGPTIEIVIPDLYRPKPLRGRRRALESRLRIAPYVTARIEQLPTAEFEVLDGVG